MTHPSPEAFPTRVCVQSRECSPGILERLAGSSLFPERPIGAAIVSALHRPGGSVVCLSAPALADAEEQVGYYLRLGGATTPHRDDPRPPRSRVTLLSLDDLSFRWLSQKLLDPDRAEAAAVRAELAALVEAERTAGRGVLLCQFEPSEPLERLADSLGIPLDQAPSWTIPMGTKTAGRQLFQRLGIPVAAGTPLVHSLEELAAELAGLVRAGHRRFVLKLDSTAYGAGMGNAFFTVDDARAAADDLPAAILAALPEAQVMDPKLGWPGFVAGVPVAGVLAEELLVDDNDNVRSPSVQGRLGPAGAVIVSTHEQVLAANRQTYTGSAFPASSEYRARIVEYTERVGAHLLAEGIDVGDYGVDFIVIDRDGRQHIHGCELNLRATGTRHGFDMVTTLLGVRPDATGELRVDGSPRVYVASDGITDPRYVGIRPAALIDAIEHSPLHYDPVRREGVVLHLLSALPEYGKFGAVCVAETTEGAARMLAELELLALRVADQAHLPL